MYGADSVRFFILSDSPPEKDVQWSEQGMNSSYKFVQKFWQLHQRIMSLKVESQNKANDENIEMFTNVMINKFTKNLESFHYNVIIANMHEIYNFLSKEIKNISNLDKFKKNYTKILKIISPVIPHLASECLENLKENNNLSWPTADIKYLNKDDINIVIQVNGKKRGILKLEQELQENEILKIVKNDEKIKKFLDNKDLRKTIYVKNKILNIIL